MHTHKTHLRQTYWKQVAWDTLPQLPTGTLNQRQLTQDMVNCQPKMCHQGSGLSTVNLAMSSRVCRKVGRHPGVIRLILFWVDFFSILKKKHAQFDKQSYISRAASTESGLKLEILFRYFGFFRKVEKLTFFHHLDGPFLGRENPK